MAARDYVQSFPVEHFASRFNNCAAPLDPVAGYGSSVERLNLIGDIKVFNEKLLEIGYPNLSGC